VQSGRSLVQGSAPRRGRCSEPSAQATGTEDRNLATGNALSAPLPSAFCAAAAAFGDLPTRVNPDPGQQETKKTAMQENKAATQGFANTGQPEGVVAGSCRIKCPG